MEFSVTDDGMQTERMVGDEAEKIVWNLTTKRKEINIYIISFNPYNNIFQIFLSPVCMWGAWGF